MLPFHKLNPLQKYKLEYKLDQAVRIEEAINKLAVVSSLKYSKKILKKVKKQSHKQKENNTEFIIKSLNNEYIRIIKNELIHKTSTD
jgi:hypothetical protein